MDLFEHSRLDQISREAPLAARMRPRSLEEFVGQGEIVGPGRLLKRSIEGDQLSSLILWGPPGTGKTTLAMIIANGYRYTKSHFETLSAVMAGVADIRRIVAQAKERRNFYGQRTILLVDEIHRFNKAQQDALLPHVEVGAIIFIGATTENPYFEVIPPLVSRSRVFQLKPLSEEELAIILRQALSDEERGYGKLEVKVDDDAMAHLVRVAGGDARTALNALELAVETTQPDAGAIHIDVAVAEDSIQRRALVYDREAHYNTISAFIKSLRGSDPDAALYWLAKMVYAGEDARFIARRMIIFASEDVGNADPQALVVATSAANALEWVGLPEAQYNLAQAAIYLATAPKSNSTGAYFKALRDVEREGKVEAPNHLKDASRDGKALGHGAGYKYPHNYPGHHVSQQYLPDELAGRCYYEPGDQGYEKLIKERLARWRGEDSGSAAIPASSEIA